MRVAEEYDVPIGLKLEVWEADKPPCFDTRLR